MSQIMNLSILLFLAIFDQVYTQSPTPLAISNGTDVGPTISCEPDQNKYFAVGPYNLTWNDARDFCNSSGMHLASITSAREQDMVDTLINTLGLRDTEFWTSGNNLKAKFQFEWGSSGCPFVYTNWHKCEPNHINRQHCVCVVKSRWDNIQCDHKRFFLCDKYL